MTEQVVPQGRYNDAVDHFFWDSVVTGSRSMQISRTYLAIPQAFLPFGSAILGLQFLGEFIKSILVLRDDTDGIRLMEEAGDQGR